MYIIEPDHTVTVKVGGEKPVEREAKAEIVSINGIYRGERKNLYPRGEELIVKFGDKFTLEVIVMNVGHKEDILWIQVYDKTHEMLIAYPETEEPVEPGEKHYFEIELTMPEVKEWILEIRAGHGKFEIPTPPLIPVPTPTPTPTPTPPGAIPYR